MAVVTIIILIQLFVGVIELFQWMFTLVDAPPLQKRSFLEFYSYRKKSIQPVKFYVGLKNEWSYAAFGHEVEVRLLGQRSAAAAPPVDRESLAKTREYNSVGRVPALHAGSDRFDSDYFQVQQIVLKSHHFDFFQKNLEILRKIFPSSSVIRLPTRIKKWTVISSPHVHKKSREQFEIRNYSAIFQIEFCEDLELVQNLLCPGVQMQIRCVTHSGLW